MYYADDAMFIQIASILATFDVSKALDKDGKEIMPREVYSSSTVVFVASFITAHLKADFRARRRALEAFECRIEARSKLAISLIASASTETDR